jgi:site-specific recombinase XerC
LVSFVKQLYLPFYGRKWKVSTLLSNQERIGYHLVTAFGDQPLSRLDRNHLQDFLDQKAQGGLSYSVVAHLRWDLRQILRMAVAEGYLARNPAALLFVPRDARKPAHLHMNLDQIRLFFSVLESRERVIGGLAIMAGMRPGQIFALNRSRIAKGYADINRRIYRGQLDTPKTSNSQRWAAMGVGLSSWLVQWLEMLPDTRSDAWVFPNEKGTKPLLKDNCWRRHFVPRLKPVGLA